MSIRSYATNIQDAAARYNQAVAEATQRLMQDMTDATNELLGIEETPSEPVEPTAIQLSPAAEFSFFNQQARSRPAS